MMASSICPCYADFAKTISCYLSNRKVDENVEDHEPKGVTGYNFGENPGRRQDLIIPAFVRYQAV
jgi:hypothetical protein